MRDSELRTRAKTLALNVISVCDNIDTRKGRGVLDNQIYFEAKNVTMLLGSTLTTLTRLDLYCLNVQDVTSLVICTITDNTKRLI